MMHITIFKIVIIIYIMCVCTVYHYICIIQSSVNDPSIYPLYILRMDLDHIMRKLGREACTATANIYIYIYIYGHPR